MFPAIPPEMSADVRRRLGVDPPERHVGDRAGRGDDRAAAVLRGDPGMRGAADEPEPEGPLRRRGQDDVPDRGGVVVAVPDPGAQPRRVERLGAAQADLLHRRQHELDPGVRPPRSDELRDGGEHDGHGRLVVGTEDGVVPVHDDAVSHLGVDRPRRRHGVEVGVQEDRNAVAIVGRRQRDVDVPHVGADLRPGVVLGRVEAEVAEEVERAVGDGPLTPRRARDRSQLAEQVEDRDRGGRQRRQSTPSGSRRRDPRTSPTGRRQTARG